MFNSCCFLYNLYRTKEKEKKKKERKKEERRRGNGEGKGRGKGKGEEEEKENEKVEKENEKPGFFLFAFYWNCSSSQFCEKNTNKLQKARVWGGEVCVTQGDWLARCRA